MSNALQASNPIDRVVDWFIPAKLAGERETRQLARMFLISHLLGPILGNVVPGALLFLDPQPGYPVAVLAISITSFWIFPFVLKATGRYNLLAFLSIQNLIFCILWSCYFNGGVTSPTLPWVLTIPLLAFFYIGPSPKLRLLALGQFAINVGVFAAINNYIPVPHNPTPLAALQGLGIVSTLAASGYVTMMAIYYGRILASGAELEVEMRGHLETAAELRRATAEAERAGAAKAEFVANMSHELRTPLNAVIGYSQMLLEEAVEESDAAAAADLHKIHDAGQHLLKLVNLVLDLSKIEAGRLELVPERLAVAEFIESIIDHQRPKAERKAITLTLDLPDGLKTARWDGPRVRQAVGQVVENAIKFTESGSVTVSVSRAVARSTDDIVIEVRDTGVGIEPSIVPALFEKFIVADDTSASKYGDTGLGLTLSLALCRLMGGKIAVESVVGEGSCFTFTLPCAPPARRKRKAARVADEHQMHLAA